MYKAKFIDKYVVDEFFTDNVIGEPITLKKNETYECDIEFQGNNLIVNGQLIEDPNATVWVKINNTQIPYTRECFSRAWKI